MNTVIYREKLVINGLLGMLKASTMMEIFIEKKEEFVNISKLTDSFGTFIFNSIIIFGIIKLFTISHSNKSHLFCYEN